MRGDDTIVALSSGALPSGVAVIRLSGPNAGPVLVEILGQLPPPRTLRLAKIRIDGKVLDSGLVAWMPGPQSFTGEDCVELHVHGSRAVVKSLLRALIARPGIRLAEAGEFTRRAFENGKLDLVEAQGLGDLIEAETENQRALAYARLEGGLTRRLDGWRDRMLDLRAEIEARLDFSDEGDVGELPESFAGDVAGLRDEIASLLQAGRQGRIVRSGFRVVLAGPPNTGKSSLLNALSRSDVAIVSDEAGTTRDLKEVPLDLDGQLVILVDSAGLRETDSKAEALGIDRAREAMRHADLVLWLQAPDLGGSPVPLDVIDVDDGPAILTVGTKSDLAATAGVDVAVSALTGGGIEDLLARIGEAVEAGSGQPLDALISHEQDQQALLGALAALDAVALELGRPELAAELLRQAANALERLLGRMDAESVLDRLFSAFCIGK
jgi:tRNA modification GTPase